jgi:hypothetical protein
VKLEVPIIINKKLLMKTFTIITDEGELNHHYEIDSIVTSDFNRVYGLTVKTEDIDDFLSEFLKGERGYKIQLETDVFCLTIKNKCYVSVSYETEKSDGGGLTAFVIRVSKDFS